jgi:hypothetical protein
VNFSAISEAGIKNFNISFADNSSFIIFAERTKTQNRE